MTLWHGNDLKRTTGWKGRPDSGAQPPVNAQGTLDKGRQLAPKYYWRAAYQNHQACLHHHNKLSGSFDPTSTSSSPLPRCPPRNEPTSKMASWSSSAKSSANALSHAPMRPGAARWYRRYVGLSRGDNAWTDRLAQAPRTSGLQAPVMELTGHSGEIFSAKFDPTGNLIASAGMDRTISELCPTCRPTVSYSS